MLSRTGCFASAVGLLWLAIEATTALAQPEQTNGSLPPGAVARLGSLRFRCRDSINCVALSPDGKYVAAGGGGQFDDFSIQLWDCATGELIRRFAGHQDRYWDLAFSPDGSILVSGGADGTRYWDVNNGTMLNWNKSAHIVTALAISKNGKISAAGTSGGAIHLWNQSGKEYIGSIASSSHIEYLAFSPDGRWLVSTGWDPKSKDNVRFWDVGTRRKVWELPGHELEHFWRNSVAFSGDGSLFAMGTEHGEVQIWNTRERKQVRVLTDGAIGKRARVLGFAKKDTEIFSLGFDGKIRIWDLVNGKLREAVKEHVGWNVALSPDADTIAYADIKTVKLWDVRGKKQRIRSEGHHLAIRSIDFAPDGKMLASCADDHSVRIWDMERRTEFQQWTTGKDNHAWQVRFSKDGKTVTTANWNYVELRNAFTGALNASHGVKNSRAISEARILPDQKTAVSVDDKRVHVWNIEQKRVIRSFPAPEKSIYRSSIAPDGHYVALTGEKGIALLDTTSGKPHEIEKADRPETLVFSPDGHNLAWPNRTAIVVWDVRRMEVARRFKTTDYPRALSFDRTGRYLAAGANFRIRIWDLQNGNCAGEFTQVGAPIYSLAFSPTQDLLASAGDDGTVMLWDLKKKVTPPPLPSTDVMLRKLLAAYRSYGMPTPPAHAKLVLMELTKDERMLGLLIKPARGKDKNAVYWHLEKWHAFHDESEVKFDSIEPTPAALGGEPRLWDDNLDAAIHCEALGWNALAKALFESRDDINPETAEANLAANAWSHWKNKLQEPGGNWPEIARRLRAIMTDRSKEFGEYEKKFVLSLEKSLAPSTAKPGSLEAMVDGLIEISEEKNPVIQVPPGSDSPYYKLAIKGFDAVPTLIEHLDDERLTKAYRQPFNNFPGYHYRICDFATDILQNLAGNDLGAWRLRGDILGKADAQAWWEEAKKLGEEGYLLRHVLGDEESTRPNWLLLEIITKKYDKNLPQVYRKILADRPKMDGLAVLHAISKSSIPAAEKRRLFILGIEHKNPTHQQDARELLKRLDAK